MSRITNASYITPVWSVEGIFKKKRDTEHIMVIKETLDYLLPQLEEKIRL